MSNRTRKRWEGAVGDYRPEEPLVIPPPVIEHPRREGGDAATWRLAGQEWWDGISTGPHARWAQGFASPSTRATDAVGVCVSGGGIRSATVALGALNALREKGVLRNADYLVSVSGGGYMAGGLQLAMTGATDGLPHGQAPASRATATDAFAPGSPEEDHLRRHSSYIADGLRQWLVALGVLLRGVLSSLVIIGLTVTTLGLAIGEFYTAMSRYGGGNLATLRPSSPYRQNVRPRPIRHPVASGRDRRGGRANLLAYLAGSWRPRGIWRRRTSRGAVVLAVCHPAAGRAWRGPARAVVGWSWLTWKLGFSLLPRLRSAR